MPLWGGDLPEFSKPVAVNTPPRSEFKSPYSNTGKIQTLKKRIINYILSDCNASGAKIIKKSNIKLLVDEDAQKILIKAVGGGRMCLNNINSGIVQNIATEEDLDYTIKIEF